MCLTGFPGSAVQHTTKNWRADCQSRCGYQTAWKSSRNARCEKRRKANIKELLQVAHAELGRGFAHMRPTKRSNVGRLTLSPKNLQLRDTRNQQLSMSTTGTLIWTLIERASSAIGVQSATAGKLPLDGCLTNSHSRCSRTWVSQRVRRGGVKRSEEENQRQRCGGGL